MLKKLLAGLLGGGDRPVASEPTAAAVEYKGYQIVSQPSEQDGQYRVSGWIRRPDAEGEVREHRFERSDTLPSREACDQLMVSKARRFIDELGETMFDSR